MSKFKIGDKVRIKSESLTGTIIKDDEGFYILDIISERICYYESALELVKKEKKKMNKTPHERLLDLGFVVDDETYYYITYMFNGLEIVFYKEEKTYQTYSYQDNYNPINLQLAEILVDYLKELENE